MITPSYRLYRHLKNTGVLGINRRNVEFILKHNPRHHFPLVDDKLNTKKLALEAGIKTPELYGVARTQRDAKRIGELLARRDDFVIKPACGSGGNGILVIIERVNGKYRKSNGEIIDNDELRYHTSNIISGMYSLGGHPDTAIIEYRIKFDPLFKEISHQGVPDIRIIVFEGVPVMSMVRLPTSASEGKANLHQGAIGTGIDIGTGITMDGVCGNEIITHHLDTGKSISGVQIPDWRNLLLLASKCGSLTKMGYIGVDIAIDRELGPLILELNARPGLNIQLANQCPLLPRLKKIEDALSRLDTPNAKVDFCQNHLG